MNSDPTPRPWKRRTNGEGVLSASVPGKTRAVRVFPSTMPFQVTWAAVAGEAKEAMPSTPRAANRAGAKERFIGISLPFYAAV
jgi:hypothetical protein